MMDLYNIFVCITLLHISGCNSNMRNAQKSIRITYTPKRLRSLETPVKVTIHFARNQRLNNATVQVVRLKVSDNKNFVTAFNKTLSANKTQLEIPCEVFATPGRYSIEYFIQGLTKTFILLTARPIIVRSERIQIIVPKNHTAFDGSVTAWLKSKSGRCKPFKGKLKLYWIKSKEQHVLVTTKKINKGILENRTRVHFRCNVFDTAGIFYFLYISDYNNRIVARSQNMSVFWGKYEITAQSKNIFPCFNSFVIKFSSPYCDRTEDMIEMKSKAYNNLIDSQVAYHGFKSVFFSCEAFKNYIREYCFYYVTKSSLSKERKIQTTLCVPSKKIEPRWTNYWTEWSPWGSCTSAAECGNGRKYRLRSCLLDPYQESKDWSKCTGKDVVEFMPCTLPPCKECKSCGCTFSSAGGTIVSPKFRLSFLRQRSNCHWFVQVAKGMKVKLWFDSLRLAKNSSVVLRDGNSSTSEILKRIYDSELNEDQIEDIYSTSNVISIWYSYIGRFNLQNNTGFQLSYASIDLQTSVSVISSTSSQSETAKLAKMTFIGILAVLVVITFAIVAIIIVRIKRQRSNKNAMKTVLSQRPSSSRTSTADTACMSESTTRSFYEPQLSADESVNNNSSLLQGNNNHRPRMSTRIEHRPPIHICPRCCTHVKQYPCEYNNGCHTEGRRILYTDSHYGRNVEHTHSLSRAQRVHSIIERRLSGASASSEEDFQRTNYPTYL